MAMTTCPMCGKEISDKALKCVQCGCVIKKSTPRLICPECGVELAENEETCHNCGAPINKIAFSEQIPQQVEITGMKFNRKNKKFIAAGVLVVAAIIIAVFGIRYVQRVNAEKKAEEIRVAYDSNLKLIATEMIDGAATAEECGSLIHQVWYNAIYEERDTETDEFTCPDGYFVSDFNDALENLFSDSEFSDDISEVEDSQETVQELMKKLKNPPEDYEDAYDAVSEFYNAYTDFTNIVTNPTGTLYTFSQKFEDADSNVVNCYEAMDLYLD